MPGHTGRRMTSPLPWLSQMRCSAAIPAPAERGGGVGGTGSGDGGSDDRHVQSTFLRWEAQGAAPSLGTLTGPHITAGYPLPKSAQPPDPGHLTPQQPCVPVRTHP
jgi:hypothetical protein